MTSFERSIYEALADEAGNVSRSDATALLDRAQRKVRRRRRLVKVAGGVAAVAIAATLISRGFQPTSQPSDFRASNLGNVDVTEPGVPCRGAQHLEPAVMAKLSESPVYLPPKGATGARDAWTCQDLTVPIFMYGDIQLSFEPGWDVADVESNLKNLASLYGGTFTRIQGLPTWSVPAQSEGGYHEILMIRGHLAIRLLSLDKVPFDDLTKLANSLVLTDPLGKAASDPDPQ